MTQLEYVEKALENLAGESGITATELAQHLQLSRSSVSRYLNALTQQKRANKQPGRPVRYYPIRNFIDSSLHKKPVYFPHTSSPNQPFTFTQHESMKPLLQEAMAAMLYPPHGLPILLHGETGVGKSHLAHTLYQWVKETSQKNDSFPYISFNCAEYAQNPDLLLGQLFGVKQGAYTGASERVGLVERAAGGVLFLDEIHRLPPSGQEMLFQLLDQGRYRRLGEADQERSAHLQLIGATTENPSSVLLPTLIRRFALSLTLPPLRERTPTEREALLNLFLRQEAKKMSVPLVIEPACRHAFLTYDCIGNTGQLQSDIQTACARAFLRRLHHHEGEVTILPEDLPPAVTQALQSSASPSLSLTNTTSSPKSPSSPTALYSTLLRLSKELEEKGYSPYERIRHLQEEVDKTLASDHVTETEWQGKGLIDEELMAWIRQSIPTDILNSLSPKEFISLSLHIQALLEENRLFVHAPLPVSIDLPPPVRHAAQRLAEQLASDHSLSLPPGEIELLALLLSPRPQSEKSHPANRHVAVLVAAHGNASAQSMADVANSLLGESLVHAVDMPLSLSPSSVFARIRDVIQQIDQGAGVLMLTDIGSLTTIGEAVSDDTGILVETLSDVSLSMVIDAGRKTLLPNRDLSSLATSVSSRRIGLHTQSPIPHSSTEHSRVIATLCLTGEGAALSLENWIREHILPTHPDIQIRPVGAGTKHEHSPLLAHLAKRYQLVAVIGTVDPKMDHVPFFPAWELLQSEGPARLNRLLEASRPYPDMNPSPITSEEIPSLAEEGLLEISEFLQPRRYCQRMDKLMVKERVHLGIPPEQELGIWIHLGLITDRLLKERITGERVTKPPPPAKEGPLPSLSIWERILSELASTFELDYSQGYAYSLATLTPKEER
ncbi:sigma 54-interacting transcriptional regulator [Marininema halotolerans]|uniref:Transcriptional regulator containing an AAA-type ATPase domain and a DNA-binding domain n=1 Tax=Marininema halotolerans TaxID=1155944 RepID=A0A1I6NSK4_9BACL|nr:sigma 54-interacting transcriptional regulator [Marininema halotolerans]SFS30972.1 Transcriptional regulator containing an AAA-type ATPase domain and a DNA-binding domain [Marininema halotolerans]